MKLQKQPNKHSCLITAFAIVIDEDVNNLIKELGHDGSEVIRQGESEPFCYRGFHPQELTKLALKRHKALIIFDIDLVLYHRGILSLISDESIYINQLMINNIGVICGHYENSKSPHAVAWDGKKIYDPSGDKDRAFEVESFLMVGDLGCQIMLQ